MLGLTAFGGALPLARREIVERRKWLDADEFTDLLGLCQFLPGGNVINLSVAIGMRFRDMPGALAGTVWADRRAVADRDNARRDLSAHASGPAHRASFRVAGGAAAAGLLIAMSVKILWPLRKKPKVLAVALVMFVAIAFLRTPLLPSMLILTPISVFIARKVQR